MRRVVIILSVLVAGLFLTAWVTGEWRTAYRLATLSKDPNNTPLDWYQPLEVVRGRHTDFFPTAQHTDLEVGRDALTAAIDYAEAHNSHALLIYVDGAVALEHYWNGHGPESLFPTYSFHKTVSALLVGLAIEDGHIEALDDPIADYLPELNDSPKGDITIRQLLHMESGIGHPSFNGPIGFSPAARFYFGPDLYKAALDVPVSAVPGTVFDYGNAAAQHIGLILQRVLPVRYADYLSERLWMPMGGSDASVYLDRAGGRVHTYCCLNATARDWLRLGVLFLNDGDVDGETVLPPAWLEAMHEPATTNPNYGRFLWLGSPHTSMRRYSPSFDSGVPAKEPFIDPDTYYLDGNGGQRVYVLPSFGMVIVRIGEVDPTWDDSALPNLVVAGMPR